MQNFTLHRAALAVAGVLFSSSLSAAGFHLSEHSANGLGRAFAGEAAKAENASALAANPAAMSEFDRTAFSLTGSYINPNIDVEGTSSLSAQTPAGDMTLYQGDASDSDVADAALVPAMYLIQPLNDRWAVGLGIYSNYGLSTDYSEEFSASLFADKAEIMSVNINPSVSYRLNDRFSIGFGLNAVYADAEIGTTTPGYFNDLPMVPVPGGANIGSLEGDDWGYGWNVGTLWKATDDTTLALTYRSEVALTLEGSMSSDLVAGYNQGGSLDMDLPAIAEFAADHQLNDRWSLQFSAVWTQWSSFDKLEANLDSGEVVHLKDENFSDTWKLALGATHKLNNQWTLRAGYAYDEGAVDGQWRSLSIPDTDRQWFTAGASYQWDKDISLDAGFAYIKGRDTTVNESETLAGLNASFSGQQQADVQIMSLQLNYLF